jgi:transcriptional regulator with XRE-family HTH domain
MHASKMLSQYLTEQGRGGIARLSEATGLSPGHIHDIANGRRDDISLPTARALAQGTGIKVWRWLGLTEAERKG